MVPRGQGTIIFTGATASIRGASHFAAFAAAKGGVGAEREGLGKTADGPGEILAEVG